MNNFENLQSMSIDEFAEWLDEHLTFDNAPYTIWFDQKYCKNCEPIMCKYPDSEFEFPCAWCELNDGCKFLTDTSENISNKDVVKMWLKAEVE